MNNSEKNHHTNVQLLCPFFYSHVDSTSMAVVFYKERRFGPIILV